MNGSRRSHVWSCFLSENRFPLFRKHSKSGRSARHECQPGVRLHHRRRRLGGLRARKPADGGSRTFACCVLEAGPQDYSIFIHMPSAFAYPLAGTRYNWHYESEPEPYLDNRRIHCPRGRVIGGSSSINGMVYIRGHAFDYDAWAKRSGPRGLVAISHCLPYFKKSRRASRAATPIAAASGPLRRDHRRLPQPALPRLHRGRVGKPAIPYTEDMNGYQQEGLGVDGHDDLQGPALERGAGSTCRPAQKRPNFDVRCA